MSRERTRPRCIHCDRGTQRIHPILGQPVCPRCQRNDQEKYGFITKTRALGEYRLRPIDLRELLVYEVDNPHYKKAAAMQLYLHSQVRELAASRRPYIVSLIEFTDELLAWFLDDPERLKQMGSEKFQNLIANRLERMGLGVQLLGNVFRRDGGIDIVGYPKSMCAFPFLLAVQTKHHHTARKTGSPDIRNFHSVLTSRNSPFQMGMIVTNTSFSPDATWFAKNNQALLRLRDLQDVCRWLQNDFINESEWREIPSEVEVAPGIRINIPRPKRGL